MRIIVTDGNQRASLAIVRSLGSKGFKVYSGEYSLPSLSSVSKYCYKSFLYSNPFEKPKSFIDGLLKYCKDSFLIPITDACLSEVLKNRKSFSERGVVIPFSDYERYEFASDKYRLLKLAQRLNIPIPKTLFIEPPVDEKMVISECDRIDFPLVIKPFKSVIKIDGKWMSLKVGYVNNILELKRYISLYKDIPFLIQERIKGPGIGIFFLAKDGDVAAYFSHRRIREKPPTGGVSVLCESIDPPENAFEAGKRIVKKIGLTGPVMVEFKKDIRDGVLKLMEINARFWGSLNLSILSGIDFPYLLYLLTIEGKLKNFSNEYRTGVKLRWILGDLDNLLSKIKHARKGRLKMIKEFMVDFMRSSVHTDVLKITDPLPFILEFMIYLKRNINFFGLRKP